MSEKPDDNAQRESLAKAILDLYKKVTGKTEASYQMDPYSITYEGGTFYLDNTFDEYFCANEAVARQQIIDRAVDILANHAKELTREEKLAGLLPSVRDRCYFEEVALQMKLLLGKDLSPVPRRPLCEELVLHLVIDQPSSIKHVTDADLAGMELSFEEAMELAVQNLAKITPDHLHGVAPGLYVGPWEDCHAPSRLIFTDFIRSFPLKGKPIACAVNRQHVFITGADDVDNHAQFIEMIELALKEPRPMSPHVLILEEQGWKKWRIEKDLPCFEKLQKLQIGALWRDYNTQKNLLEEIHEKEGTDLHVAKFYAVQIDGHRILSRCIWIEGVTSLLPQAEIVIFSVDGEVVCEAEWATVYERVGSQMKPQGMYPERYLVDSFPHLSVLQELDQR